MVQDLERPFEVATFCCLYIYPYTELRKMDTKFGIHYVMKNMTAIKKTPLNSSMI